MSALLQNVPRRSDDGGIFYASSTLPVDHYTNGLPYDADGALACTIGAAVDHWHQGLPFTQFGRLAVFVGNPDHFGGGAAPFNAAHQLCIGSGAPANYSSGVGYLATGRVSASTTIAPITSAFTSAFSAAFQTFIFGLFMAEMALKTLGV